MDAHDMLQKHSILHALMRKYCGPRARRGRLAARRTRRLGRLEEEATGTPRPVRCGRPDPAQCLEHHLADYFPLTSASSRTTQTYYLADRSNHAVDVVDAKADMFVTQISASPPFAGASPGGAELSGPNGVLTARGCIIATDAGDRVVSFMASGLQVTSLTISAVPGVRMSWHSIPRTTCCSS